MCSANSRKLPGGAPALAVQPRLGQAGLGGADRGDRLGARLDLVGDGSSRRARSSRLE
jgi:hypothetical protein